MPSLVLEKGLWSLQYFPQPAGSPCDPDGGLDAGVTGFGIERFCLLPFEDESRDLIVDKIPNLVKKNREKEAHAGMQATMMATLSSTMLKNYQCTIFSCKWAEDEEDPAAAGKAGIDTHLRMYTFAAFQRTSELSTSLTL